MQADDALVSYIASTYYEMSPILGSIKQLPGYDDRNFLFTDSADNKTYVLKIVNRHESAKELTDIIDEILSEAYEYCQTKASMTRGHFVVPRLIKTSGNKLSTLTTIKYKKEAANELNDKKQLASCQDENLNNVLESSIVEGEDFIEVKCNIKLSEYFDGVTMFDYINRNSMMSRQVTGSISGVSSSNKLHELERLYFRLGKLCNQLFVYLRTHVHLVEKLKSVRARGSYPWALKTCDKFLRANLEHLYPIEQEGGASKRHPKRVLVENTLEEFVNSTRPKLDQLPEYILHSDLCNKNILIDTRQNNHQDTICLIDFQDLQVGQQVIDLAIMMLYNVLEQEHMPFEKALALIPRWIYLGYQSSTSCPLDPNETNLIPSLMKLRLCQSLLNGQIAHEKEPENSYVMHTNQRGWELLELMSNTSTLYGNSNELAKLWLLANVDSSSDIVNSSSRGA